MTSEKIFIYQQDNILFIESSEIIFLKSDNCYTNLYIMGGKVILVSKPLAKFQKELDNKDFIRVNQSYLVSRKHIESINKKKKHIQLYDNHFIHFTISLKALLMLIKAN